MAWANLRLGIVDWWWLQERSSLTLMFSKDVRDSCFRDKFSPPLAFLFITLPDSRGRCKGNRTVDASVIVGPLPSFWMCLADLAYYSVRTYPRGRDGQCGWWLNEQTGRFQYLKPMTRGLNDSNEWLETKWKVCQLIVKMDIKLHQATSNVSHYEECCNLFYLWRALVNKLAHEECYIS